MECSESHLGEGRGFGHEKKRVLKSQWKTPSSQLKSTKLLWMKVYQHTLGFPNTSDLRLCKTYVSTSLCSLSRLVTVLQQVCQWFIAYPAWSMKKLDWLTLRWIWMYKNRNIKHEQTYMQHAHTITYTFIHLKQNCWKSSPNLSSIWHWDMIHLNLHPASHLNHSNQASAWAKHWNVTPSQRTVP